MTTTTTTEPPSSIANCDLCGDSDEVKLEQTGRGWVAYCWGCYDGAPDAGHYPTAYGDTRREAFIEWNREVGSADDVADLEEHLERISMDVHSNGRGWTRPLLIEAEDVEEALAEARAQAGIET